MNQSTDMFDFYGIGRVTGATSTWTAADSAAAAREAFLAHRVKQTPPDFKATPAMLDAGMTAYYCLCTEEKPEQLVASIFKAMATAAWKEWQLV